MNADAGDMLSEILKSNSLLSLNLSTSYIKVEHNKLGNEATAKIAKVLTNNKKLLYLNIGIYFYFKSSK